MYMCYDQRLAVCLEECIYIHRTSDMQVLHIITDVASDARGLCALSTGNSVSSKESANYLAYPSAAGQGQVQIFNTVNLVWSVLLATNVYSAHVSDLFDLFLIKLFSNLRLYCV